jgi:ABC-type nitrate/sulfonate/bicarbonate transport system substrate-binding protein
MADRLSFVLGRRTPALMDTLNRVAERGGFYASEGLAIENVSVGGAAEAAEVCSSGRGDICPIGIEPIFTGYADGIRLKLFFARLARYTYVLGVPADGPVRTPADFRGRTIGVHILGAGSAGKVAVDSMMAAAGLTESDYALRAIGYEHDAMDAVTSGAVAGAAFPGYELIPFELAGHALRVFRHPVLGDIVNGGYAASPSTIEEKAGLLARFARAIVKASLFVQAEPLAAARFVLEASNAPFTGHDVAVKARELQLWDALPGRDPASMQIGYIPPAGIEAYSRILVEHGLLQHAFRADDVITNRFVAFANDVPR